MGETPVATGMEAVVSALTTGLTPAVFFDTVADIIPFVIVLGLTYTIPYGVVAPGKVLPNP